VTSAPPALKSKGDNNREGEMHFCMRKTSHLCEEQV
jgi:hypothetical protein